ncbi:DUF4129 domain-containing protein [Rosistilla oblonga]|uniref:Protein-glutamine gamma-glutamyltransferase-like C-terminal domain-containing protein n=1 Tax=Rosistilla oblonga TaxID=2527990 RepID=A0A518IYA7_9BACT|nr:DUF4129 domain-containing protein [Rosistilla oblonga]QDV58070.1 hypothetical protein Mal33_40870 [Rosistilla oblonga]
MVQRRDKTTIDYIVIALNPALIVTMIASLVYFLTLCMYRGDFIVRINYILFLFIVAAVGIARIAIEEGRGRAMAFALGLGAATLLSTMRFVGEGMLMVVGLLTVIWYLADRITIDCTLIDEQSDASGEGLMQGGLFGGAAKQESDVSLDGTTQSLTEHRDNDQAATGTNDPQRPRGKKRGHRPGMWILYLAFAAIPLYGLGQVLLPGDTATRDSALRSLAIYLASSLLLLVTTSFLGMRRYLRQRGVDMPAGISIRWLGFGAALVAGLLMLCFLLPKPGQLLASLELPASVSSPEGLQANKQGWGDEGVEKGKPEDARGGEGEQGSGGEKSGGEKSGGEKSGGEKSGGEKSGGEKSGGEKSGGDKSGGEKSGGEKSGGEKSGGDKSGGDKSGGDKSGGDKSGGDKSGSEKSGGEKSGGEKSGGEKSGGEKADDDKSESGGESADDSKEASDGSDPKSESDAGEPRDQQGNSASEPPPPPTSDGWKMPNFLSKLSELLRFLIFALLAGIVAFYAMRHWDEIVGWLRELFNGWGGNDATEPPPETAKAIAPPAPPRPFSAYANPLDDASISMERAVVVSFNALNAWAREHDCPRPDQLTPTEFTQLLGGRFPEQARNIMLTAEMYNVVVYGNRNVNPAHRKTLQSLWSFMQQPASRPAARPGPPKVNR